MLLPVSVFIITKDEEDRLPVVIKSVIDWVDEVIVIDSGSSDKTVEIAQSLGAKVVYHEWKGYGPQKVYGETLCRNRWLLNIDADEEISLKLKNEIKAIFAMGEPRYKAYKLDIKDVSRFSNKIGMFSPSHVRVRLYHKDYFGFKESVVHDSVIAKIGNEPVGICKYPVLHRSFRSYSHAIAKINRYSTMQAEDMLAHGRRPSIIRIVTEPVVGFLKGYFIKRYCFLGVEGFIEGIIYAFARTLRLAKARELWHKQDSNKGEDI